MVAARNCAHSLWVQSLAELPHHAGTTLRTLVLRITQLGQVIVNGKKSRQDIVLNEFLIHFFLP